MLKNVTFHRFKKSDFNEVSKFTKYLIKKLAKFTTIGDIFKKNLIHLLLKLIIKSLILVC